MGEEGGILLLVSCVVVIVYMYVGDRQKGLRV